MPELNIINIFTQMKEKNINEHRIQNTKLLNRGVGDW